jgi:hypothetical protein
MLEGEQGTLKSGPGARDSTPRRRSLGSVPLIIARPHERSIGPCTYTADQ